MFEATTAIREDSLFSSAAKGQPDEKTLEGAFITTEMTQDCDYDKCKKEAFMPLGVMIKRDAEDLNLIFDLVTPHEVVPYIGASNQDVDVYFWVLVESPIQSNLAWTTSKNTFPYYLREMLAGGTSDKSSFLGKLGEGYNPHMMIIPYRQGQDAYLRHRTVPKYIIPRILSGMDNKGGTVVRPDNCKREQLRNSDEIKHVAHLGLKSLKNQSERNALRDSLCSIVPYAEFQGFAEQDRWPGQHKKKWLPNDSTEDYSAFQPGKYTRYVSRNKRKNMLGLPWPHKNAPRNDWGVQEIGHKYPGFEKFAPGEQYETFAGKPLNSGRIVGAAPGLDALNMVYYFIAVIQAQQARTEPHKKQRQAHIIAMLSYGKNFHYKNDYINENTDSRFCSVALDDSGNAITPSPAKTPPRECPGYLIKAKVVGWQETTPSGKDSIGGWNIFPRSNLLLARDRFTSGSSRKNYNVYDELGIAHYEVKEPHLEAIDGHTTHKGKFSKLAHRLRPGISKNGNDFRRYSPTSVVGTIRTYLKDHHEMFKFFLASGNQYPTLDHEAQWQFENLLEGSFIQNKDVYSRGGLISRYPKSGVRQDTIDWVDKLIAKTKLYYPSNPVECVLHNVKISYELRDGTKKEKEVSFHTDLAREIHQNKIIWRDITKPDDPRAARKFDLTITRCCREPTQTPILAPSKDTKNCATQRIKTDSVQALSIKTLNLSLWEGN